MTFFLDMKIYLVSGILSKLNHIRLRLGQKYWVKNNLSVYRSSGKLLEKYNVEKIGLFAEGGEYTVQDGFGWTNGVLLSFLDQLGLE